MQVYDGTSKELLETLSGYLEDQAIPGVSASVIVHFHTDDENVHKGWRMFWQRKRLQFWLFLSFMANRTCH